MYLEKADSAFQNACAYLVRSEDPHSARRRVNIWLENLELVGHIIDVSIASEQPAGKSSSTGPYQEINSEADEVVTSAAEDCDAYPDLRKINSLSKRQRAIWRDFVILQHVKNSSLNAPSAATISDALTRAGLEMKRDSLTTKLNRFRNPVKYGVSNNVPGKLLDWTNPSKITITEHGIKKLEEISHEIEDKDRDRLKSIAISPHRLPI